MYRERRRALDRDGLGRLYPSACVFAIIFMAVVVVPIIVALLMPYLRWLLGR